MRFFLFVIPLAFCLLMSCQKQIIDPQAMHRKSSLFASTKVEPGSFSYSVSLEDMERYVRFIKLAYKKDARSIIPVPDKGETALYIVNYESGWQLVSADKRATVVLGESEEGEFSMASDNMNMRSWIETLIEEILILKREEDIPEGIGEDALAEMKNNLHFWSAVTADSILFRDSLSKTKTEIDPDDLGYWELVSVDVDSTFYDAPPRLISTHWSQYEPFNYYCPVVENSFPIQNKAAGSVSVAGAQMAYFLHNLIGYPETAPGHAQGYPLGNPTHYYLSDETDLVWPYMSNNSMYNGCYSASMLITSIAYAVFTNFSWPQTTYLNMDTNLGYLADYFASKGVSCSTHYFSEGLIGTSLLNGTPVIATAKQTSQTEADRHCFIIDGYKRYNVTYTYTYIWHYDDGSPSYYAPDVVIDNVGLQVTQYCMNWGWGGVYDNSYYVSSAAGWHSGNHYYQYKGTIVHGFAPAD